MGATRFTLSPEDGLDNMEQLLAEFGEKATVIVYQDTPLFISESCVRASSAPCPGKSKCSLEKLDLVSSHGDDVIAVNRDCRTILISKEPFCLAGRLGDLDDAGAIIPARGFHQPALQALGSRGTLARDPRRQESAARPHRKFRPRADVIPEFSAKNGGAKPASGRLALMPFGNCSLWRKNAIRPRSLCILCFQ